MAEMTVIRFHVLLILTLAQVLGEATNYANAHNPAESQDTAIYESSNRLACSPGRPAGLLPQLADLDMEMRLTLASMPQAIAAARAVQAKNTADVNRDKFLTGIACFMGALSGSLGILYDKDPFNLSPGDQMLFAAQNFWGYGYWGPYLLDLQDTEPGCGIQDFNKVVSEYSFIISLQHVYGGDLNAGGYASQDPNDRPELRQYYLAEFGRKLKLALHCITSQAGSFSESSRVVTLIDEFVALGTERLLLTASLIS